MNIKPIRSNRDYEAALDRIETLMGAKANTPEGEELDILVTLIEAYETSRFSIPQPNPLAAIQFVMEQNGLKQKDLEPYIGHSGRVSEVLSGKRKLTIEMIRKLSAGLKIPAETLIQEYDAA